MKAFGFFFLPIVMQMVESVNIKSDCETKSKKEQTYSVCLTTVEKYKKVKSINKQNDYKKISKK